MNKLALSSALAATMTLSACATTPYGYNNDPYYGNRGMTSDGRVATGAGAGAVAGAVLGAVVPGVRPITGAIAGAVLGGVAAAVINNRQYYRDTRGACYYVDRNGNPIYDYRTRC